MNFNNEYFDENFGAIFPESLDEIITNNRDFASLRLTTDLEVMELYAPVVMGEIKEVINDWRFITLEFKYADTLRIHVYLIGDKKLIVFLALHHRSEK